MDNLLQDVAVLDISHSSIGTLLSSILAQLGAKISILDEHPVNITKPEFAPDELPRLQVDTRSSYGCAQVLEQAQQAQLVFVSHDLSPALRYVLSYHQLQAHNAQVVYVLLGDGRLVANDTRDLPFHESAMHNANALDEVLALALCNQLFAALSYAKHHQQGQFIDLSDCHQRKAVDTHCEFQIGHPHIVPYQVFPTKDGYIALAAHSDDQFATLCQLLSCAELKDDQRFASNAVRLQYRVLLTQILIQQLVTQETQTWLTQMRAAHIPCGRVLDELASSHIAQAMSSMQMDLFSDTQLPQNEKLATNNTMTTLNVQQKKLTKTFCEYY